MCKYSTIEFGDKLSVGPKYGFGNDSRYKDYNQTLPGPTSYEQKSMLGTGVPKATMPGRRKDLRPKSGVDAPGAGAY